MHLVNVKRMCLSIGSEAYWPAKMKIAVGTTVRFLNNDALTHTVTANSGSFSSPFLTKGKSWKHAFSKTGKYPYHCKIHPFMHGTIIVTK